MSTRRRGGVTGSALAQPPQDLRQSLLNGSNVRRKKSLFENELLNVVITLVMQGKSSLNRKRRVLFINSIY